MATYDPGVFPADFIATITFINPYDTATQGKWDYGLFFRNQGGNTQYRLAIFSNQSWILLNRETRTRIYSSNDKRLNAKVGEANTIWLIVIDKKAHLFINGSYIRSMDLGNRPERGNVLAATGIYYGNVIETSSTNFSDFIIWKLPRNR